MHAALRILYDTALTLAVPAALPWLALHPRHRPLLARFRPATPAYPSPPVWVHACSMGEVGAARPILAAMHRRWPGVPLALSVSTRTGYEQATANPGPATVLWFPFDHPLSVRGFFRRLQPRVLVLLETELWPNVLHEARRRGVPVVLANGRLSDKHYARYQKWRPVLRPVFGAVDLAAMQNAAYAQRIVELGAPPERVVVTGCTKFDGVAAEIDGERIRRLRAECGLSEAAPTIVFGSTRPGDEVMAAACWRTLKERYPALRLIVAPRHLDRLDQALAPFAGEQVGLRSEQASGNRQGARVLFVDTMGELTAFYGMATVAVVGGSFDEQVQGHNPLEPAALGVPTVFGPHMLNFRDPARVLIEAGGAVQLGARADVAAELVRLLDDPRERALLASKARRAIQENQGAIERTLDLLEPYVQASPQTRPSGDWESPS